MKMKAKTILLGVMALLLLPFLLSACSASDPIHDDLLNYSTKFAPISKVMDQMDVDVDKATADTLVKTLKESIIPKYQTIKQELQKIEIKTPEVKAINDECLKACDSYITCFTTMADAVEKADTALLNKATDQVAIAGKDMEAFSSHFKDLAGKHNVEMEK